MPEVYATEADVLAAWPEFAKLPDDARAALVEDANAIVRDHLGRDVLLASRSITLNGKGLPRLWLPVTPVLSVDLVEFRWTGPDWQADECGWSFDAETGALHRGGHAWLDPRYGPRYAAGVGNWRVTYFAGLDPVPPPIRRATTAVARRIFDVGRVSGVYKSETLGDWSYTLADGLPAVADAVARWLRPYRAKGL